MCLAFGPAAWGQYKSVNPQVKKIGDEVSEARIAEILKKLQSFGTRNTMSSQDHPTRGIGAARRWIYEQFKSYSPRLQVSFDSYTLKKQGRITRETELHNVIAVLPGKLDTDQRVIISGHYDSLVLPRRTGNQPQTPGEALPAVDPDADAPGVTDDGSGTAAVMELARIMSQLEFDKTLVFIAFAGEENGLIGSTLYAENAKKEGQHIEGVLNNDIIGSDVAGDGRTDNFCVNVFSEEPNDSASRELARYIRQIGERYYPAMDVDLVFRADRFGRGGDHTSFNQHGFAAVRISTPTEDFANQHSLTDTFANTSVPYIARVTRVNGVAAACLALAPRSPAVFEDIERNGRKIHSLMLGRGKSRYDAQLRWKMENPEPDLAGYVIVMRATTAPYWEKEIYVGNVTEYTMPNVSIDELVFGVKAIDKDGNESLVIPYVAPPRPPVKVETEGTGN